jgi:hypothetical protein
LLALYFGYEPPRFCSINGQVVAGIGCPGFWAKHGWYENGKLIDLEMVPHQIRKFRLNQASKQDAAWLKNTLHREGQKFNTRVDINKDGVLALRWRRFGSRA